MPPLYPALSVLRSSNLAALSASRHCLMLCNSVTYPNLASHLSGTEQAIQEDTVIILRRVVPAYQYNFIADTEHLQHAFWWTLV